MRYLLLIGGDRNAPPPTPAEGQTLVQGHAKFADALRAAGKMVVADRLRPDSDGARVRLKAGQPQVIDGPFAETKELIAGFWLWQVKSKEEAIEWVKRCPNPMKGESEIEIRQLFEAEDFGAEFTPELREQEERLRAQIGKKES